MANVDRYIETIDTIYPDGYARESLFRSAGEMLSPGPAASARTWFGRFIVTMQTWHSKRNTRAALRELTDGELRDIGVTPAEARREVAKSWFWD